MNCMLPKPGGLFEEFDDTELPDKVIASIYHDLARGNVDTEAQAKDWGIAFWRTLSTVVGQPVCQTKPNKV